MSDLLTWFNYPIVGISIAGIAAMLFYLGFRIRRSAQQEIWKEQSERVDHLYNCARLAFDNKEYLEAVQFAAEAAGTHQDHEAYNILAHAFYALSRFDLARSAFDKAHWHGRGSEEAPYYAYRVALLYIREENWDLAYARAAVGVSRLEKSTKGRYFDETDLLCELRAIKILSAFFRGPGTNSLDEVQSDIAWLEVNANNDRQRSVTNLARKWGNEVVPDMQKTAKQVCFEIEDEVLIPVQVRPELN